MSLPTSDLSRRSFLAGVAAVTAAPLTVGSRPQAGTRLLSPVLFVVAHPDDETLAMGVAIAEHVAAGQDVHVLWLTRGTASGIRSVVNGSGVSSWWRVQHNPPAEGYTALGIDAFGQARIDEATTALRCLSAGLAGILTVHEAELADGRVTQGQAKAAILAVADVIAPGGPVRVKTHSHIVDNHPDHLAVGHAARSLKAAYPGRFSDLRHYILPTYWSDSRLSQVTESWDTPTTASIAARAVNACRAFAAWHPPASYAVGWHSVHGMFKTITAAPKCLFHP